MCYPRPSLLVAGLRRQGDGERREVVDPSSGEVLADFFGASTRDIDDAAASAEAAFRQWSAVPAVDRAAILRRAADLVAAEQEEIAVVLSMENGKPLGEARAEVLAASDVLHFYAGEARRTYGRVAPPRMRGTRLLTVRDPVGVVAAFAPWNFPAINLVRKLAPALAAGCTIIAKPAEETPATGLLIASCLERAGLPVGALNILYGEPDQISRRLIENPVVRKITFTGSTAVGRRLAARAGEHLKRATMELGGHAPVIICKDADPDRAAGACAAAKFRNAGQTCNSASRFYVHASLQDRFLSRFAGIAANLRVGAGLEPNIDMGPLSNARRVDAVDRLVRDAVGRGARIAAGGTRLDRKGFFYAPTVLADVPSDARIMAEEPFGPVAPIVAFEELDEAVEAANSTPFGLAAYAITDHAPTIRRLSSDLRCGVLGINTFVAALPETPFGGIGDSGWGHEGGPEGIDAYLQTRFIHES